MEGKALVLDIDKIKEEKYDGYCDKSKLFHVKINLNKPYRFKGSSPYIYWARAYFASELEIL